MKLGEKPGERAYSSHFREKIPGERNYDCVDKRTGDKRAEMM